MKFLLTSAGITNDELAKALLNLLEKPVESVSVVFIPTAAYAPVSAGTEDDKSWLTENINQMKAQNYKSVEVVDIASAPVEFSKQKFVDADLLIFGGGSEHYLAKVLHETGLSELLKSFTDKVYVGISAGSMVVGKFISTELIATLYPEESYNVLPQKPLELLDLVFIPHMNSDFFTHVRKEALEKLKGQFSQPTYATDDHTALSVSNGKIEIVGPGESWMYLGQ